MREPNQSLGADGSCILRNFFSEGLDIDRFGKVIIAASAKGAGTIVIHAKGGTTMI